MQQKNRKLYRAAHFKWFHAVNQSNTQSPAGFAPIRSYPRSVQQDKRVKDYKPAPILDDIDGLEYETSVKQIPGYDSEENAEMYGKMSHRWSMFKVIDDTGYHNRCKEVYFHPGYTYEDRRAGYTGRGYSKADADFHARANCLKDYESLRQFHDDTRAEYWVTVTATYHGKELASADASVEIGPDDYNAVTKQIKKELTIELQSELHENLVQTISDQLLQTSDLFALLQTLTVNR